MYKVYPIGTLVRHNYHYRQYPLGIVVAHINDLNPKMRVFWFNNQLTMTYQEWELDNIEEEQCKQET